MKNAFYFILKASGCAFLFVETIPFSASLYLVRDMAPIEIMDRLTWPLSAVIKGGFRKNFFYEHEKFAYNKYK